MAGPWDDKLEATFDDPEIRATVDEFLRSNVQPYVTQLEQKANGLEDAEALYNDLLENPGETFLALSTELFGDEAADKIIAALEAGEDVRAAAREAAEDAAQQAPQLTPEQIEAIEYAQNMKRSNEYQEELNALKDRYKDDGIEIVDELFAPFVAITQGDMDAAYAGYKQHYERFKNTVAPQVNAEDLEKLAPPTINSDSGGGSPAATPTQEKYDSLDDALDAFLADLKSAPPTVGSV